MTGTIVVAVAATLLLCVVFELLAAVLPLILVLTLVRPEERRTLADLLAAADCSHRLRLWSALRRAVATHR
jgi:hypothetical protein